MSFILSNSYWQPPEYAVVPSALVVERRVILLLASNIKLLRSDVSGSRLSRTVFIRRFVHCESVELSLLNII